MTSGFEAKTIGQRLRAIAARAPEDVAVVEGGVTIGYGQLDRDATAIARRVLAATADREGVVGLLYESKLETIRAIFGVARSGRAYVPLDARDPEARLRFILDDSAPSVIVAEPSLVPRARALAPAGCEVIDTRALDCSDTHAELPVVSPDTLLYLHYTSGSTGTPKGVGQTHRNVVHFADVYANALGLRAQDRLGLLYTMSFAAANSDVFRALLHGATICAYDMRRDGIAGLADWLDRERVSVLHVPPTAFREVASRLAPERVLPHLRILHLGGEAVFGSDVEQFRRHTLPHCVFVNQLASTEAGVVAQYVVDHRGAPLEGVVPVGRCVEGVRVEIRRHDGTLADAGEAGEIVVCSPHVAPGYRRRPDLDAAAFSVDAGDPGTRRYRSGDLGRLDADGNLHFLGRIGSRVKIRGHSVDLAEVEAALAHCPGVATSAAAAIEGSAAEPARVIAFVVSQDERGRDPQRIRRFLADRLPSYMWPAEIAYVDALPLTATGKVDRNALVASYPSLRLPARTVEPPHDDVERGIARIFEELLRIEGIGRGDDFFLLGGDSLMAVELQCRLRDGFGVEVAGQLLHDASVGGLAAEIRRGLASPRATSQPMPVLVPLWRSGRATPLFLVHGRNGQAFVSPHFLQLLGNDQPVWAFQARGLDGSSEPHASVEAMVEEYLGELRRERPHGPYFLGSLCAGAYIVAVMARTLAQAGEKVLPLLLLDPPNTLHDPGYAQLTDEQFTNKMLARSAARGRRARLEDPESMRALLRTARAFDAAIARHTPRPYDGPAYVLSSDRRMHGAEALNLRRIFTGRYKRYEVGANHANALDPRNPVFARALRRCVELIRQAGGEPAAPVFTYQAQGTARGG